MNYAMRFEFFQRYCCIEKSVFSLKFYLFLEMTSVIFLMRYPAPSNALTVYFLPSIHGIGIDPITNLLSYGRSCRNAIAQPL